MQNISIYHFGLRIAVLTVLLSIFNSAEGNCQITIFSDPGETYNNTDSRTEDFYGPIDISACYTIQVSMDYYFSDSWEGSGNMETSDECNFSNPCDGDPNNPNQSGCEFCWDFLWFRVLIDGNVVFQDTIGEAGTTNAEQSGTISFTDCNSTGTNLEIEVYTQTWAAAESVTFSNIQVVCWDGQPIATATPNPVCLNETVQLDEVSGLNYTNWSWTGPNGFSSGIKDPVIGNLNTMSGGIYTVTVEYADGCVLSDDVELLLAPTPTINNGVVIEVCGTTPHTFDLTSVHNQLNNDPSLTFEWYEDPTGTTPIGNPPNYSSNGGLVYVSALDPSSGCYSDTVSVELIIQPEASFTVPSDVTICEGLEVNVDTLINPSNTNLTYSYHDGVPPTPANEITGTTSFTNNSVISVIGTNSSNCSDTQYVNLTVIDVPVAPPANPSGPYCEGEDIILSAAPPILPFITYTWTGPNGYVAIGPDQTIPNALPSDEGIYELTATLAGCTSQPTSIFVEVTPLPSAPMVNNPLEVCHGQSLMLAVNGGSGLSYMWSGPNGFVSNMQNPLVTNSADFTHAGIYSVSSSDGTCVGPASDLEVIVLDTPNILLSIDQEIACSGGNDGAISVMVPGGTLPITYDWADNQYDGMNSIFDLSAGTYSITITDGNGCQSEANIDLTEPSPIQLFCDQDQAVSMPGGSDGVGEVFISGGSGPFDITYDNGQGVSGNVSDVGAGNTLISNLEEGTYQVIVTDGNGCTTTCTFTIGSANCSIGIQTILQLDSILCFGDSTASLEVLVAGGSGNYNYRWERLGGEIVSDSSIATGLQAGLYYIIVEDANEPSCTAISNFDVMQPQELTLLNCSAIRAVSMPDAMDGEAQLEWYGGISPYTIFLTGPVSDTFQIQFDSLSINSLGEGTYNVIVQDTNDCTDTCTFSILSTNCALSISLDSAFFTACPSDSSLSISIEVDSQTTHTVFVWNQDTVQLLNRTDLSAGTHMIEAVDTITGCRDILNLDFPNPTPLDFYCEVVSPPTAADAMNGEGQIIFNTIAKPYDVYLSGPSIPVIISGETSDTFQISDLDTGLYTIIVTDSLGCVDSCSFAMTADSCVLSLSLDTAYFSSCPEDSSLNIDVSVNSPGSQIIYILNTDTFSSGSFSSLPPGSYSIYAIDTISGCTDTVNIDRNFESIRDFSCTVFSLPSAVGSRNGIGGIIIDSIYKPYSVTITSYNYSNNRTNLVSDTIRFNNLDSGLYFVTVTDSLGCTDSCSFFMPDGGCDIFSIDSIRTIQPGCMNNGEGSIAVFVSGGSGNYSYDWNQDFLDGESQGTGLSPGIYRITVTDLDLNCTVQGQRTLQPVPVLDVNLGIPPFICEGDSARLNVEIVNGSAPYTLTIDQANPVVFSNDTSVYITDQDPEVEITDARSCSYRDTLSLRISSPAEHNLDTVLCDNGSLSINGEVFDIDRPTGQVILEGAAQSQCDSIINVNIEFQSPDFNYYIIPPSCAPESNSKIRILDVSGASNYFAVLNGEEINLPTLPFEITNLPVGEYELYIESETSCQSEIYTVNIEAAEKVEVSISAISSIRPGDTIQLEGRTSAVIADISWQPRNLVSCDTCLVTNAFPPINTLYTITVIDENGCMGSASIEVLVTEDDHSIYIPNSFTPNGDGLNDFFTVYGPEVGANVNYLRIFDRWGDLLFENQNFALNIESSGWDGTSKGNELDPGVYIYSIELSTETGDITNFTGTITLLK